MATIITPPFPATQVFDRLLLGTIWNARALGQARDERIGLIVNCTDETIPRVPNVSMIQLGLQEGNPIQSNKIEYALTILRQFYEMTRERQVLVCSHRATSRGPAIVLAYLLSIGMGREEAEGFLLLRHSLTKITPAVLKSVWHHFGWTPSSVEDVIRTTEWKEQK
jgi:hypothetical protein